MKKTWWKEAVVYQIYPRSFADSNGDGIGDLNGITDRLDYLKELGIDVIWLSPVYKSPNDDNGYDISDYEDIMDEFGTMADFDRLLAEAHARGIRIVMDLVVNHTSDEHKWFLESRSSVDNPKRDYYFWREGKNKAEGKNGVAANNDVGPENGAAIKNDAGAKSGAGERDGAEESREKEGKRSAEPNNWGSFFSGPAWEYDETTDMYYLHLFSRKQPDLNWDNPQVRREVFAMMTRWCEKGIDGFRMDVINLISKPAGLPDAPPTGGLYGDSGTLVNGPRVHEYLQEMNREVLSRFDIMTVGETGGVTLEEAKKYTNSAGTELNMVFQFEHIGLDGGDGFKWSTRRMPLVALKENLTKWQKGLDGTGWNSLYFCNHDQPRIVNRLGDPAGPYRERSAKCIATCLHMMQGTPYVYQGEELGMTNYPFRSVEDFQDIESISAYRELTQTRGLDPAEIFPAIACKSRDNARTPMQWDDTANAGFTTGTPWLPVNPNYREINAKDQTGREDSVFHYYKKLIALRHRYACIVYGSYDLLLPEDPDLYVYTREWEGEHLLVVCNFSAKDRIFTPPALFADAEILIRNLPDHDPRDGKLAAYEAYVLYTAAGPLSRT